ncbi:MAG: chemotaxis protein CheW [Candidatus Tectomicrobia bacterium]|nr:chemotaxis protein CheW [Candidatus Tectomicrobia bacterium]
MVTNLNKKMLTGFSHEVRSYLPSIRKDIEGYRHNASQSNGLEEALRHLHTIKGASALMGLFTLSRLTTCVQELLENVLAGQAPLDGAHETWLSHTIDRIEPYLDALLDGDTDDQELMEEIEQSYSALRAGSAGQSVDTSVADEAPDAASMLSEDLADFEDIAEAEAVQDEEQPIQTEHIVFAWSAEASESQDADATEPIADDVLTSDDEETLATGDDDANADEIEQTEAAISSDSSGIADDYLEDGAGTPDSELAAASSLDACADADDSQPSDAPEEEWVSKADEQLEGASEYPDSVVSEADAQVQDESDDKGEAGSSSESRDGTRVEELELTELALAEPESEPEGRDGDADETLHATESETSPIDAAMHGDDPYAPLPDAADDELEFGSGEVDDIGANVVWTDASESQTIATFTLPEPADTWYESSSQDSISSGERILSAYNLTGAVENPPATSGALDELIESIDHEVREVYQNEALSTSRRSSLAYMRAAERYVTFVIADSLYAVPVTSILEIGRVPRITAIPNVPPWIPGVINLRGEIISVIDLRAFLGIDEACQADSRRMLVVKTQGEEITTSLVVDQVRGFVRLDTKQLAAAGTSLDDWVAPYLTGVFEYEDQVLAVMDLESFLLSPEICQFD